MASRASDDIERAHLRDPADRSFTIHRRLPPASLRPWLRRYWIPVWDVPEGERAEQRVLQYIFQVERQRNARQRRGG